MKTGFETLAEKSLRFVRDHCRPLESARIASLFFDAPVERVIEELSRFQNDDGGFGDGLEPDFALPDSSPMATSIGLQIIREAKIPKDHSLAQRAIRYLQQTFNPREQGWVDVPYRVNEYPHAPWWHYKTEESGSPMKGFWGNPTAELIGHLVFFGDREDVFANASIEEAVRRLLASGNEMETHELYCYLRLYESLTGERQSGMQEKLAALVESAVCLDTNLWNTYRPQPIDFVQKRDSFLFARYQNAIRKNVAFLLKTVSESGAWNPTWTWGSSFPDAWEKARMEWVGIITVKHLKAIEEFDGRQASV